MYKKHEKNPYFDQINIQIHISGYYRYKKISVAVIPLPGVSPYPWAPGLLEEINHPTLGLVD